MPPRIVPLVTFLGRFRACTTFIYQRSLQLSCLSSVIAKEANRTLAAAAILGISDLLESVLDHALLRAFLLTIIRTDAGNKKTRAFRYRHSQSLARRRQRLSQARVRSTTQRLGSTTNLFTWSDRLTISTLTWDMMDCIAPWNIGP